MQYIVVYILGKSGKKREKRTVECPYPPFFTNFALHIAAEGPREGIGHVHDYMEKTFTGVWLSKFKTSQLLTCRKNRWQPVASSWCVYPRAVSSACGRKTRHIHIGVGFLRCPFSTGGHAKALNFRTGESKIPAPFSYISVPKKSMKTACRESGHGRRRTHAPHRAAYQPDAPRAGAYGNLVCKTIVLHPSQRI